MWSLIIYILSTSGFTHIKVDYVCFNFLILKKRSVSLDGWFDL